MELKLTRKMEVEASMSLFTPALLINTLRYSGTTPGSLIRLRVEVVPDLCLGTIVLSKGKSNAATTGKVVKGTGTVPGSANITISAQLFDNIVANAATPGQAIEVEYTSSSAVLNIFIGPA